MRKFRKNTHGVSNIMGYMFSFAVASMVMVSAVFITMNIVDDKTSQVARIEAQSIANYVANTVAEMVAMKEANPNAEYSKTMDIPVDLAGKSYYIEVTADRIYVNTTDGHVTASCTTYHADELNIGTSGKINGGGGQATLSSSSGDYVYKLDFGTGNDTSHSPVESGYYHVGVDSRDWNIMGAPYRVPIRLYNPSSEPLIETPVKIILNTSNFDYDKAIVVYPSVEGDDTELEQEGDSSADVRSNLHFYDPDPANEIAMDVRIDENNWYPHWNWVTNEVVRVSIDPTYPDDMKPSYIDGNTLKLGNIQGIEADCESYSIVGNDCVAVFDLAEAFKALGIPPETINEGVRTLEIKGKLLDGSEFSEPVTINVIYGDIRVNADGSQDHTSIQSAINEANPGDTIYVYEGTYQEQIDIDNKQRINLTGQDRNLVIIDGYDMVTPNDAVDIFSSSDYCKITSFTIIMGGRTWNEGSGGNGVGIRLDDCIGVQIANCDVSDNNGDGIRLENNADNNIIRDCKSYDNNGIYRASGDRWRGDGIEIENSDNNRVINCEFYDNDNEQGKGIRLDDGSKYNIIENCEIYDNDGEGGDGITIANKDESTPSTRYNIIANCTISRHNGDNGDGIAIWSDHGTQDKWPSNNTITNCTIRDNYGNQNGGVVLWRAKETRIIDCTVNENGVNIWLRTTENTEIRNCSIYDAVGLESWGEHGIGIHIDGDVTDTTISDCDIYSNSENGVIIRDDWLALYRSNNNTIRNCDIYGNGHQGIWMFKTMNNVVENCSIHDNTDDGLVIKGHNAWSNLAFYILGMEYGNIIQYCNFYENGRNGIKLTLSDTALSPAAFLNRIRHNNFYCNGKKGVYIKEGDIPATSINRENHIYGNNFIQNYDEDNENARDNYNINTFPDEMNYWDNGGELGGTPEFGNYWDDIDARLICGGDPPNSSQYEIPHEYYTPWDDKPRGPATICSSWTDERRELFPNPNVIYAMIYSGFAPNPLPWYITTTIQEAINRATPGGTIYVKYAQDPIPHSEPTIIVNKSVRIIGVSKNGVKPIIRNSGGGPVFNVTNMSFDSNFDFYKFDTTIYFDSLDISNSDSGIYVSNTYNTNETGQEEHPPGNNVWINISNCKIHDNINGISLHESYVNITNCDIIDNEAAGINLSDSSYNNIVGCRINSGGSGGGPQASTTMDGIVITDNSNDNEIRECNILYKRNGIHIIDSGNNDIDWCTIKSNGNGTYIEGDSDNNDIRNCDIEYNTYGIYITGATAINNVIHHNDFYYNTNNANSDSSPNTWDDDYPSGGNYWDDYTGIDDDGNWDGIGSTPYDIPGSGNNQDRYPLRAPWISLDVIRDYSVDFWNPYGESVILLNLNMEAYEEKNVYLYYGNSSNLSFQTHKFDDTAVFFDDFNNLMGWGGSNPAPYCNDGVVVINESEYITSLFAIPEPGSPDIIENAATANGTLYIVEARAKLGTVLQETQGNMILLNQGAGINNCYLVSNHVVPGSGNYLKLNKRDVSEWYELGNTSLPSLLDHWQRMIAQVYVGKHLYNVGGDIKGTNATKISVNLYDFTSYNLEGNISDTDGWVDNSDPPSENPVNGPPYMAGSIGLGCGLKDSSNGNFTVDWIRVRKAPVVQPSVSIGAPESEKYGWASPGLVTPQNSSSDDPYRPGALLRDLHKCDDESIFVINGLPKGSYTITITSGNNDASSSAMEIIFNDQSSSTLQFDAADAGKFYTKSITIDKDTVEENALTMRFDKPPGSTGDASPWAVNAITIERGDGGVVLS